MVRFSISWKAKDIKISSIIKGQIYSVSKLNNGWIIMCLWEGDLDLSLRPRSLEIRRVFCTDTVSINGTIILTKPDPDSYSELRAIKRFRFAMGSGSSSLMIPMGTNRIERMEPFTVNHELCCDIDITCYDTSISEECGNCLHLEKLSNDFGRLLLPGSSLFSDVDFKCGDTSIPSHKTILSARSPVFATMFKNQMSESLENAVLITDIDASVVRLMLTYMYTGRVSDLTTTLACDLLFAADKYQLDDLKELCSEFLKDNMSLQNVLRIVVLGDLHCSDLKSSAIHYICNTCEHISVLENMDEWKSMLKDRPDLIIAILTSMVKAKETMETLLEEDGQILIPNGDYF